MIVTIDLGRERIVLDDVTQHARVMDIDGHGQPFGTVREGTIKKLYAEVVAEQNRRNDGR